MLLNNHKEKRPAGYERLATVRRLGSSYARGMTMNGNLTVEGLYAELTALLIDREIVRLRRGEQAALVTFTNVAKLARNASQELTTPLTLEQAGHSGQPACPAFGCPTKKGAA